ncbi:M67 family metallopeptidase [Leptothoe sp. PORK10 BA2]|uniref:M67 family metallopeptidase n=1 Tax=Leptothoe sp. PORK10 BA2 TaxID=3110254 RepID=UPI002B202C69|nr:M67 family metallopeptidase [Leptothoe sp. PORK10 BA2]MEA5463554.1 M67 family metallopeptidase [Leptothoe sp. PORK10 BA2]
MALNLTQEHIDRMKAHGERAYPHEGCGLLVGRFDAVTNEKTLVNLVLLENAWTDDVAADLAAADLATHGQETTPVMTKARRYWIDPQDLFETQRQARQDGLAIIGVYHSHPDAEAVPSGCDRDLAWPSYAYIIVSVRHSIAADLQNWQLDDNHQFQPEPMNIVPASAAKDRMPLLSS